MPTKRWSALRLLEWYENADVTEIWEVLDPIIYSYKPAKLASLVKVSIDVIYRYRKRCYRGEKPRLETFIRILALA
jgi:hypothetical protein